MRQPQGNGSFIVEIKMIEIGVTLIVHTKMLHEWLRKLSGEQNLHFENFKSARDYPLSILSADYGHS